MPALVHSQGRQRCSLQAHIVGLYELGLEPQVLGGKQYLGNPEGLAIYLEFMDQLVRVSSDVVEAGQHDNTDQTGIRHRLGSRIWSRFCLTGNQCQGVFVQSWE